MRPPLHSPWRCWILLLLSFKGGRNDNDAIGDYQSGAWGSERGETCVLELSALASNRLSNDRHLWYDFTFCFSHFQCCGPHPRVTVRRFQSDPRSSPT